MFRPHTTNSATKLVHLELQRGACGASREGSGKIQATPPLTVVTASTTANTIPLYALPSARPPRPASHLPLYLPPLPHPKCSPAPSPPAPRPAPSSTSSTRSSLPAPPPAPPDTSPTILSNLIYAIYAHYAGARAVPWQTMPTEKIQPKSTSLDKEVGQAAGSSKGRVHGTRPRSLPPPPSSLAPGGTGKRRGDELAEAAPGKPVSWHESPPPPLLRRARRLIQLLQLQRRNSVPTIQTTSEEKDRPMVEYRVELAGAAPGTSSRISSSSSSSSFSSSYLPCLPPSSSGSSAAVKCPQFEQRPPVEVEEVGRASPSPPPDDLERRPFHPLRSSIPA
ncbi:hypothetical protein GALMADRAFT_148647 [Galerina marginata CBS 339.88]|uniref:Uncharacterized protein n=1 Tax=Galerina marginata (strain CBS 339.88) TaxID=685588 RepID=A0A067S6I7_GALM3|nr:hypothetical protein GALMADRAFT_148647 [Galerina marginata CBS 339.88]